MAAEVNLKVNSNFDQASKDLKSFGAVSEKEAARIKKYVESFKSEQIEDFIGRNKRLNAAVTATKGPLEGAKAEYRALQGQIQRLLLARAVYKDPSYIFLDEATSSLDANNEKAIMQNLTVFFRNKTVLIIAHRLSTVKNADQIVVFGNGGIMEQGRHNDLVAQKGYYYNLIKNQLELGT